MLGALLSGFLRTIRTPMISCCWKPVPSPLAINGPHNALKLVLFLGIRRHLHTEATSYASP